MDFELLMSFLATIMVKNISSMTAVTARIHRIHIAPTQRNFGSAADLIMSAKDGKGSIMYTLVVVELWSTVASACFHYASVRSEVYGSVFTHT